MIYLSKKIDAW